MHCSTIANWVTCIPRTSRGKCDTIRKMPATHDVDAPAQFGARGVRSATASCCFHWGRCASVQLTFDASTGDGALCRLMNYSTECPAGDTELPWYLDWGSLTSPISSDKYARYPDRGCSSRCDSEAEIKSKI